MKKDHHVYHLVGRVGFSNRVKEVIPLYTPVYPYTKVSWNRGTSESSVYRLIFHYKPFIWGTPIYGKFDLLMIKQKPFDDKKTNRAVEGCWDPVLDILKAQSQRPDDEAMGLCQARMA